MRKTRSVRDTRRSLKPTAGLVCLVALLCTGCSAGDGTSDDTADDTADGTSDAAPPSSSTSSPSGTPETTTAYAPYVSATTAGDTDSSGAPSTYNLAFVVADGSDCTPVWGGTTDIDSEAVASRIAKLKKTGGAVRVSFGGAAGKELALTCDSASRLAAAYAKVLDATGATEADFDMEGDALTDSASVARRSDAIALLQKERGLKATFTLPAMPSGLTADSVALLDSANDHDARVSTVNIMAMNYGTSYTGDMGDYAITSATKAHAQIKKAFRLSDRNAWQGLAVTAMIGVNDVKGETFTLADAARLRAYGEQKGLAWLSAWASSRDKQCADGTSTAKARNSCSGVEQKAGAFAKTLSG
ncbi:chitinase [Streptomyces sp. NPDC058257]|uniref:chitinase n=1 Tax=Streptomyces sp. NPDC058257 TaxID=3346409 RepID=UPI0036E60C20